ncbi:hypothetical protein [Aminipila sp.]|uniref:hypothetical protein n=1 Tax=Aminipila sp. TaxID=2060095 RepID=UPI00289C3328|nr:hypothetical protein [Aminipila sp.]
MDKKQFDAIFPYVCTPLVDKIASELKLDEQDAIMDLYESKLYANLEKESTKVWQYSTEKLFELFMQEKTTGKIIYPEV